MAAKQPNPRPSSKRPAPPAAPPRARRATPKVEENLFDAPQALPHIYPVQLKIKNLGAGGEIPAYATPGAACFDIQTNSQLVIQPGRQQVFNTGFAFEVPPGYVMLVYSRSGHGFKHGIRLANGTGIIDSDFRGELKIALRNDSTEPVKIYRGDRIAQAMLVPIPAVEIVEVEELSETQRGEGGFGSTGR